MSYFRGFGKRGGDEELWPITYTVSDLRSHPSERKMYRFHKRGSIFNGLKYPHPWDFSWEFVWKRGWRRWELGWSFETIGYNDEHYGITIDLLMFSLYTHLNTRDILPKPTEEREWKLVAMFSEGVSGLVPDVNVHYQLGPGGMNPKWKDNKGRKIGGVWSLLDWAFGRSKYSNTKGESYDLEVPLPERKYLVKATPEVSVWERPRWSRWPLRIERQYVQIDASMDPLPDPGNDDSDYYDGEDATFGTGVQVERGTTKREIAQMVADRVMAERKRRGVGYDWRPTRDWRPKQPVASE